MRLVLVHGISQEGKSEALIKDEWCAALERRIGHAGLAKSLDVRAPFYGDRLSELTNRRGTIARAQGVAGQPHSNEMLFLASALQEQAQAAGVERKEIAAEERSQATGIVEQGFPMDRRVNAIVRVIERISPLHGSLVMKLLQQAYAYLKRPGVGGEIDAIVRPVLDIGPAIIVGHSLGTVLTFKLLRQLALEKRPIKVPLFVTVGSPLTLMAVQEALGPEFKVPDGVERWLNAVDSNDFIALGRGLDKVSFADGIENILDIKNVPDNPHSIQGYLSDPRVAKAIGTTLGVSP
jgi:hypothetical protein